MSRDKIIKNIQKNITKKVQLTPYNLTAITYKNPFEVFKKNLKKAGGKITKKPSGIIIEAKFGVAENGSVYIDHKKDEDRRIYSYYEKITIKLKKDNILNNMHEAYEQVNIDEFAIFISGPSKTADIEQSLVIGAHGAKELLVMIDE